VHDQPEPDGGLTIHIATDSPPAPRRRPGQLMYRGEYTIPSVKRTD